MNRRPDYYQLLDRAFVTSVAVDGFDVKSDDPKSRRQFEELCGRSVKAQLDLLDYVNEYGVILRQQLLAEVAHD